MAEMKSTGGTSNTDTGGLTSIIMEADVAAMESEQGEAIWEEVPECLAVVVVAIMAMEEAPLEATA